MVGRAFLCLLILTSTACGTANEVDLTCDDCRRSMLVTLDVRYGGQAREVLEGTPHRGTLQAFSYVLPVPDTWSLGSAESSKGNNDSLSDPGAVSFAEYPGVTDHTYLTGRFVVPSFICVAARLFEDGNLDAPQRVAVTSACPGLPAQLEDVGADKAATLLDGGNIVAEPLVVTLDELSTADSIGLRSWSVYFGN